MSFKEDYIPWIKKSNRALITLFFIQLQYVVTIVGFAALLTFAKWSVAGDHIASANAAFDLLFVVFFTVITGIFILHLVSFLWRNR